MSQDWIIDVLADLRQYAVRNYRVRLAEQLDDAIMVAAAELHAVEAIQDHDPRPLHGRAAAVTASIRPAILRD